jgi:rhamnosyltransferase
MDASIVILTKNGGENFRKLIPALQQQKYAGEFDILVIDSGSSDGTIQIARDRGLRVVGIKPEEFHHGRTRNLGASLTTGRYIVYITQDALPLNENWLQQLTAPFTDAKVAMVTGRQISWEDTIPPEKYFYIYSFPDFRIEVKLGNEYIRDNIFISDVNSAYRREIWDKFRFSETILQAEDKEIAKRFLFAGHSIIYEPQAMVFHAHNFTISSLYKRSKEIGKSLTQNVSMPRSKYWAIRKKRYYISEVWYIMKYQKWYKWLTYSVAYEGSRLIGVFVGWIKAKLVNDK